MTIPPPDPPRAEALEDLDTIPDRACVWGPRDRDADCAIGFHDYPECIHCGAESPDCAYEVPLAKQVSLDCLRNQAEQRNAARVLRAKRDEQRYADQMDYYRRLTGQ